MFKNKLESLEKGLMVISYLIFGIGLVISIILVSILYQHTSLVGANDAIDNELTGVIGDFFGGVVGTLFALVSVLLFYLAFQHQKRELKDTNEALNKQNDALSKQNKALITQQFETTFFNLLKNQMDLRNSINVSVLRNYSSENLTSIEFLKYIKGEISTSSHRIDVLLSKENTEETNNILVNEYGCDYDYLVDNYNKKSKIIYKKVYLNNKDNLSHYFRHLYHILLYLRETEKKELKLSDNRSETEIKEKFKTYANYIQAQLSSVELYLIFYDALFFKKFKELVEYYSLIKNLNSDDLIEPETDMEYYKANEEKNKSLKFETAKKELEI